MNPSEEMRRPAQIIRLGLVASYLSSLGLEEREQRVYLLAMRLFSIDHHDVSLESWHKAGFRTHMAYWIRANDLIHR